MQNVASLAGLRWCSASLVGESQEPYICWPIGWLCKSFLRLGPQCLVAILWAQLAHIYNLTTHQLFLLSLPGQWFYSFTFLEALQIHHHFPGYVPVSRTRRAEVDDISLSVIFLQYAYCVCTRSTTIVPCLL